MGEVHRGRDLQTGGTVTLKLIWRRHTGEEVSLTEADKKRDQVHARGAGQVAAHRLPAGDGEVPPDGLVRVHCLGTRAQAPLPGHQRPAGWCPFVLVPVPVRVRLVRSLHVHTTIRTLVCAMRASRAGMRVLSRREYGAGARRV
jgi:hypothetical protein